MSESDNDRLKIKVFDDQHAGSIFVAREIAEIIRNTVKEKEKCVLGLATGSSPLAVYKELVRLHKVRRASFLTSLPLSFLVS